MTSQVPLHDFVVQDEDDAASVSARRSFDGPRAELVLQRDSASPVLHISSPPSDSDTVMPSGKSPAPRTSTFPCAADVQMLHQEIVCVGLSNAAVEVWASKIIKLVAYPELLALSLSQPSATPTDSFSPQKLPPLDVPSSINDGETPLRRLGIEIPPTPSQFSSYSSPSTSSSPSVGTPCSSSEEAYLSSELPNTPPSSGQASPRISGLSSSRSHPELSELTMIPSNRHPLGRSNTVSGNLALQSKQSKSSDNPVVPFFSFTRTNESSSLTTGRQVITALFPPNERHMVICGDELDPSMDDGDDDLLKDDRHELPLPSSTMKCLQIDLQRFGLDKHGLINKFSRVLDFGGINHMYSSTYKTANVLVSTIYSLYTFSKGLSRLARGMPCVLSLCYDHVNAIHLIHLHVYLLRLKDDTHSFFLKMHEIIPFFLFCHALMCRYVLSSHCFPICSFPVTIFISFFFLDQCHRHSLLFDKNLVPS